MSSRPTLLWCLALVLLLAACGSGGSDDGQQLPGANGYKTFTYTSEGVEQVLQVKWQNDTAISFVLAHHRGECNYTLSGEAVNPYYSYDPEQDTDTGGDTYWVDQYLYNRENCRLALRIAQDTSRVQLQITNCAVSPTCGLERLGVLRREE